MTIVLFIPYPPEGRHQQLSILAVMQITGVLQSITNQLTYGMLQAIRLYHIFRSIQCGNPFFPPAQLFTADGKLMEVIYGTFFQCRKIPISLLVISELCLRCGNIIGYGLCHVRIAQETGKPFSDLIMPIHGLQIAHIGIAICHIVLADHGQYGVSFPGRLVTGNLKIFHCLQIVTLQVGFLTDAIGRKRAWKAMVRLKIVPQNNRAQTSLPAVHELRKMIRDPFRFLVIICTDHHEIQIAWAHNLWIPFFLQ